MNNTREFASLLGDVGKRNLFANVHSHPIGNYYAQDFSNSVTTVPPNIYLVLVACVGKDKITEVHEDELLVSLDEDMAHYRRPGWPWIGDTEICANAQIYEPGDKIFNARMWFGDTYADYFNIFWLASSKRVPFPDFNRNNNEDLEFSRAYLLNRLNDDKPKIVYMPTCDPFGNKPRRWSKDQWLMFLNERLILETNAKDKFKKFLTTQVRATVRRKARLNCDSPRGRCGLGIGEEREGDEGKEQQQYGSHFGPGCGELPVNEHPGETVDGGINCVTPCVHNIICSNPFLSYVESSVKAITNCSSKYCLYRDKEKFKEGICTLQPEKGKPLPEPRVRSKRKARSRSKSRIKTKGGNKAKTKTISKAKTRKKVRNKAKKKVRNKAKKKAKTKKRY